MSQKTSVTVAITHHYWWLVFVHKYDYIKKDIHKHEPLM